MKFFTIGSAALLAGIAFAAPHTAKRQQRAAERAAKRAAGKMHGKPMIRVDGPSGIESNNTFVEYSSNWAGAILIGTGYTKVTGTFTVPKPSTTGSGAAWVGIDGDTCDTAILQTGVDWTKSGSSYSYDAWYEWYPDYSYDFSDITVTAGDVITVTVTATSKTGGTAVLENVTTGKTVTETFSNEASTGSLCEYNAEWIVEDFEEGNSLVEFADFGTVTFTGCEATDSSGTVTPGGGDATIIDIEQNKVLTSCSASGSTVTCTYV